MPQHAGSQPGNKRMGRLTTKELLAGNGTREMHMSPADVRATVLVEDNPRRWFEMWTTPLILLFLCVLSYGLLIPWLGFYWDDWPAMWVLHSLGGAGLSEYMSTDMPFLGWLYSLTGPALGESPLSWHVFALLTRWLSAVAAWWFLRGLWPERRREVAMIACLFAVYPGFTLQPIAWCHSHVFLTLGLVMFSFGAMIWAQGTERLFWPLTFVAVVTSGATMMIVEYFVGLELLRPVVLWVVLTDTSRSVLWRLVRAARAWLPYLALLVMYLFWRLLLFHPSGARDQSQVYSILAANPLGYLFHRWYVVFTDVIEAGLIAWTRTASLDLFMFDSIRWVGLGLALIVAGAAANYMYLATVGSDTERGTSSAAKSSATWAKQAVGIGLFALLAGGLPFWFGNREVKLDSLADRYTLPLMLGSALVLVGITLRFTNKRVQQIAVLSVLVGLSVGFHFRNTWQFRQDWLDQKSLFWQLSWRVPGLKPGTSVLADETVVSFPRSYSLIGPLNFIYAPQHTSSRLHYSFFSLPTILGDEIPHLADGIHFTYGFRTVSFNGSTSDSLVLWFSPPSCLRVLDRSWDALPHLPPLARAARNISHVDRIITNVAASAGPPASIFGQEPAHSWCYYFQKADLARQMEDWQQVSQVGDEARRLGFAPNDSTEWLPFIEGYLQTGRYDDAKDLAARVVKDIPAVQTVLTRYDINRVNKRPALQIVPAASPVFCRLLERLENSDAKSPSQRPSLSGMNAQAGCVVQ
ncbi:MAG: hypothetical protein ACT4OO_09035 [Nitrospiraceae bacterium]